MSTWSYSRWSDYATCPALYKFKYLDKYPSPASPAMARGTKIHELAEGYVTKQILGLPSQLEKHAEEFAALRATKGVVAEEEWGFTAEWKPTGYFDHDVWLRAKCDAAVPRKRTTRVIDYKTGREYPTHQQQTSLYALAAFFRYPETREVQTEFWYVDSGNTVTQGFDRSEVPDMLEVWHARVEPLMTDTSFQATPGESCRKYGGCSMGKSKGGPCAFG